MSVATRNVQDRRDSPRVPFNFRVRCALEAYEFEQSSGDLSTGGVFWAAGHPVPCRDVEVRVTLPGHEGRFRHGAKLLEAGTDRARWVSMCALSS